MASTSAGRVPRVAVVGGGIAGTLASLVLRNRSISPLLIDSGFEVGGRLRGSNRSALQNDAGAQFLRSADPRLATVFGILERAGLLAEWKGRFGLLGSRSGGFLPSSIVGASGMRGMGKDRRGVVGPDGTISTNVDNIGESSAPSVSHRGPTDTGDFCGLVEQHRPDTVPTYVGMPNNNDLCRNICRLAGIEILSNTKVTNATTVKSGGWQLQVESNDDENIARADVPFDALILATHDASLASSIVRAIAVAEANAEAEESKNTVSNGSSEADAAAGGSTIIHERLNHLANDLQSIRNEGRMPLFSWSARFDSLEVPFDAASVPGSHIVQFLARESSKPGREEDDNADGDIWTAVSTSSFADSILTKYGSTKEASDVMTDALSAEVSTLLSTANSVSGIGSTSDDVALADRDVMLKPRDVSSVRWSAAFTSKTLNLKEDSITLAPWFLSIAGDFIRDQEAHETPFEASALSGLEAGERVASLFANMPQ